MSSTINTRLRWLLTVAQSSTVMPPSLSMENAQIALRGQFEIDQLVAQAGQGFIKNALNIHASPEVHKQKNGRAAIFRVI